MDFMSNDAIETAEEVLQDCTEAAQEIQRSISHVAAVLRGSEAFRDDLFLALNPYLTRSGLSDGGPLLLVENTGLDAGQKMLVVQALWTYAHDIGGLGVCFKFESHDQLAQAHAELSNQDFPGNIAWCFTLGAALQARVQAMVPGCTLPPQMPLVRTRMITGYSRTSHHLTHDRCDFFVLC